MAYTSVHTGVNIDNAISKIIDGSLLTTEMFHKDKKLYDLLEELIAKIAALENGDSGTTAPIIIATAGPNLKVGTFKCGQGL